MTKQEKIKQFLREAPTEPSEKELAELNTRFPPYIFRCRRTREIWTSCCGRHEVLPKGHPVLEAEHTPEEKPVRYGCHMGYMSAPTPKPKPKPAACPFCGRVSPVKELGRNGERKNLYSWRRAMVLRWHNGALWAVGYDLSKSYMASHDQIALGRDTEPLTALPSWDLRAVYRFEPGRVSYMFKDWWPGSTWTAVEELRADRLDSKFKLLEPFGYCTDYGLGYDFIGEAAAGKSPFRWCGLKEYKKKGEKLMRFLAVCTVYPRQVEMLMKAGLHEIVVDFVERKKNNARLFKWDDPNPIRSFGLTKPEMKEFLASKKDLDVLWAYKALRKAGVSASFPELETLRAVAGSFFDRAVRCMRDCRLSWPKLQGYLDGKAFPGKRKGEKRGTLNQRIGWWVDYIDAAKVLGYDLSNPVFATPKDLMPHHDKATAAAVPVRDAKRANDMQKKEISRLRTLTKNIPIRMAVG